VTNQPEASRLAREAFEHWQAGRLLQAKDLYREALALADPAHWGLSSYHGEFACVLNELGEQDDATKHLSQSLEIELAQGNPEGSPSVVIARYFLSEQLLRFGDSVRALAVLAPSVAHAPTDWCTRAAQARALFADGRMLEAREAANLAVTHAPSSQKAEELKLNLSWAFAEPDA
jgi:Flp pilus assembly protein TadD